MPRHAGHGNLSPGDMCKVFMAALSRYCIATELRAMASTGEEAFSPVALLSLPRGPVDSFSVLTSGNACRALATSLETRHSSLAIARRTIP